MNLASSLRLWTLALALGLSRALVAAPPTLTNLYPAGGQAGQTVEVTASGTFPTWPVEVHIEGDGLKVEPAKTKGKLNVVLTADAKPGVRWLRVSSKEGVSEARAFVVGSLPEIIEKEPNNDPLAPQTMSANEVVVNGKLQASNDVDTFAVQLTNGATLVASLQAEQTLGSPMDAILQVVSADGFVLSQNHDTNGLDPQITFSAPAEGTYLVRVFAFPSKPNSSIRFAGGADYVYRLTLTTGPFVDHSVPLAVSQSTPSTVALQGWNLPSRETSLAIPASNEDIAVSPPKGAGLTSVRVVPHAVLVEKEADAPMAIDIPVSITGKMDTASDEDVYTLTGKKGQRIAIRADSHSLGHGLDLTLQLLDAKGTPLSKADDRSRNERDCELAYTLRADGDYRIVVQDNFHHTGFRSRYLLTVTLATPDFTLSTATDRFVLTAGKTVEIPVTIGRLGGFKDAIELSVKGLPAGVTAKPVTSMAKGATAKSVKLALSGKCEPTNATITIVGKSATGIEQTATTSRPGNAGRTSQMWLSVVK